MATLSLFDNEPLPCTALPAVSEGERGPFPGLPAGHTAAEPGQYPASTVLLAVTFEASALDESWLPHDLPTGKAPATAAKRRAIYRELEQTTMRIVDRYEQLRVQGSSALSAFDINIVAGGNGPLALATALALSFNQIRYLHKQLAAIRLRFPKAATPAPIPSHCEMREGES